MAANRETEQRESDIGSSPSPDILTFDRFVPHAGKRFRFAAARRVLTLDRVDSEGGRDRRPFTLIFCEPRQRDVLPEGLYDCEVEDGPSFRLYVAPIHTPRPDRQDYQAVFN